MWDKVVSKCHEVLDVMGFGLYLLWIGLTVLSIIWVPLALVAAISLIFAGKLVAGLSIIGGIAALALMTWALLKRMDTPRKRKP